MKTLSDKLTRRSKWPPGRRRTENEGAVAESLKQPRAPGLTKPDRSRREDLPRAGPSPGETEQEALKQHWVYTHQVGLDWKHSTNNKREAGCLRNRSGRKITEDSRL